VQPALREPKQLTTADGWPVSSTSAGIITNSGEMTVLLVSVSASEPDSVSSVSGNVYINSCSCLTTSIAAFLRQTTTSKQTF